jgi:predicted lipoprotein with Yx(FWY)xxD motif
MNLAAGLLRTYPRSLSIRKELVMHTRLKLGAVAVVAAGTLSLAACGSGGKSSSAPAQPQAAPASASASAATAPAAPTNPAPASTTVKVVSTKIGPVLASADGLTLYRFDKDTGTGSNCNAACAQAWPPLIATSTPTGSADVGGALGVITRADGRLQVTYLGHPVYHYAGDGQPGDTTGDGFGGIWHAVHPSGSPAAASTATTSPSSTQYGY